ncbi:MAG: MarR family transcriptional regulator [Gammaproteobacteria bacterium]|uniref:MarR family transcriptional regulator n=1 Tax=SAR86 cluster bacterium TaxID=2030880 RepID=A0A368C2M8_9GAMM|nr:MAG: MarR family transcriptional regulator [SAR86 cluster bacterium]RPG39956.1 MAG: MarR family transcriptional regulator [Gammaproteobacteria bacterium TMED186]
MKSFKEDLMEAIALVSNIEHQLKINTLNGNEKTVFYSILLKEKENTECIISDVINISKLSRSTVFKTLKKLEDLQLILSKQSTSDKRELVISVNV